MLLAITLSFNSSVAMESEREKNKNRKDKFWAKTAIK
jgi:hypothetical protein